MRTSDAIHDLTLMLLYLSSWEEGEGPLRHRRAWKGYDFDVLDALRDEGYAYGSNRSKSVMLTDEGVAQAEELLAAYDIAIDPAPKPQRFFRLHLAFDFEELSCHRTLLVPTHTSFEDFHTQIQACFNWLNYHLYDFAFSCDGKRYCVSWPDYATGGDPREDFWPDDDPATWLCSQTTYLDDFLPKVREMTYSYDYGDGWEIKVALLNANEPLASDVPICWDGSGDAPPEDVGGEGGFEEFLRVIADPSDSEYEHFTAWGEGQGFERFSERAANARLARWQDFARTDIDEMPRQAQLAAFGKVLVKPRRW